MAKFSTLIFDFDGTIGDTLLPHLAVFKTVAREMKIDFPEEINLEEQRRMSAQQLIAHYKLSPLKLAKFIKKTQQELNKTFDQIAFYPGMEELLLALAKKYRLGILSSNSQENIEKFLAAKKMTAFDFVYTGKNLFGKDKLLQKIIKQEQLSKEELLYFGDELRDVEACQRLGIKVAAVTWGFDVRSLLEKAGADFLFDDVKAIAQLLIA